MTPSKVLFVCLGNICRSPMAEGIFRDRFRNFPIPIFFDSAGVAAAHSNEAPDKRAIKCLNGYGIDISMLTARPVKAADFSEFDLILSMDSSNYKVLKKIAPYEAQHIHLLLPYSGMEMEEVEDPWYGDEAGFEVTYRLLSEAAERCVVRWSGS
jgi:protein-tyrosine phosphatase